ncbi:MAG: AsmA domain protein [Leptospirales bacterium]|nr:AsmA domain protein [Leptospirales bacterium]
MKKIIYFVVIPVLVILIGLVGGTWFVLNRVLNENFLVQQIESSLNVRAEIKKLNVSLFSAMSSVELEGLSLAPRDTFANQGTDLAERTPIKNAVLSVNKVDLKFSLLPLLAKRFELKRFLLIGPNVSMTLYPDGTNSLTPLFKKPLIVAGKPNPALTETAKPEEEEKEEDNKPFSAKDLPISANLKEIGIKEGNVNLLMAKTGQLIRISALSLVLDSIDIDPADLVKHNSIRVSSDANVVIVSAKQTEAAGLLLQSGGTITPFDAKTGHVNTGVEYSVVVKKDSFITGMAAFDQLAGELPVLNKVGFSWNKLAGKAAIIRDVTIRVSYSKGLVTFLDDAVFPTANYDLYIKKGSTLNATTNAHNFNASVRASDAESKDILARFDRGIEKKLKGQSVEQVRARVLGKLIQEGRVELPFSSLGNIASPDVKLLAEIPSLNEILTGGIKDALQNKLDSKIPGAGKEILNKLPF